MLQSQKFAVMRLCALLLLLAATIAWPLSYAVRHERLDAGLVVAVQASDARAIHSLLARGASANASAGHHSDVSLSRLIKKWLPGSTTLEANTPALILAIRGAPSSYEDRAGYERVVAIVKDLLEHGAWPNSRDDTGEDAISLAIDFDADSEILRLLLQHLSATDPRLGSQPAPPLDMFDTAKGMTPLMHAAAWGAPEQVKLLLEAGASPNVQSASGQCALMMAVEKGRPDNVECLLAHHANPRLRDLQGNTALSMAIASEKANTTTPFNHERDDKFWTDVVKMLERTSPH